MNLSFPLLLSTGQAQRRLPPPRYDPGRRACRRKAREAEWNFRVSKGYVKDTFWNHLRFRSHRPGLIRRKGAFYGFLLRQSRGAAQLDAPPTRPPRRGHEQDYRKRARDAGGTSASPRAMKDTFWNRLWFRLTP